MGTVSIWHWFIVVVVPFLVIYPSWKIIKRTGLHPAISLLMPFFGIIILWWLAFAKWPAVDRS